MQATEGGIQESLQRLLAPPDKVMRELGTRGERLVARARLLLCVLALPLPLLAAASGWGMGWTLASLGALVAANATALLWLLLARGTRPWLPYATTAWDLALVTILLSVLAMRDPASSPGAMAAWPAYLVVVAATALRADGRLPLFAGGVAALLHAVLSVLAAQRGVADALLAGYGARGIGAEGVRLLLLAAVTLVAAVLVRRMQQLVEVSGHDALTGLPNRSWLLQRMPHVFASARNSGASLSLVLVDIDRFRRVNDEAGPQAGDRALRHVASGMSAMLRDGEALARIGGQEFVMVLHCPAGSAWERLDRLRRTLVEHPFLPERGRDAFAFTFSAGLAAWPQDGTTTSGLLGSADRRLKSAKAAGGNRIVARDP